MFSIYRRYRSRKSRNKQTAKDKSRAYARQLKRKIKKCELCGKGGYLEVHHRDHNALNNKRSNLIKICLECHIEQHRSEPVAHLMRGKKKPVQKEVDRGPIVEIIKRLIQLFSNVKG